MAIAARTVVDCHDQDGHDRLNQRVAEGMAALGGPPEGLMAHVAHPTEEGLVIFDVWRAEEPFQSFWTTVLEPAIVAEGFRATSNEVLPVWSFARP